MRVVVITGANRGIGLELAKLYSKSDLVYALCRTSSNELTSLKNTTVIENVDVSIQSSVDHAIQYCPKTIDVLINNAGILKRVGFDFADESILNDQWRVNAMGPLRVIKACFGKFNPGSKIALISSRMGSISDNDSGSHYGYRMSKAALNAAGKSLAIDLAPHGVSVAIIHPGWVQTDMTGHTGQYRADQAANQIMARMDSLTLNNSGTFWHSNGTVLPW